MHELSVCQALLEQVARLGCEHGARRVVSLTLRIGPLSGVEPALLESAYPLASAGTIAADAALIIERPAIRVRCRDCGAESGTDASHLVCGACGRWRIEVLSGDELLLVSVELEKAAR
jgi:hydrogenase nickel incorporation protein HypA/HybF